MQKVKKPWMTFLQEEALFVLHFSHLPWRRKWQPPPVVLPGKSHGQRSLVGCSPRGRKESDTTGRFHFLSFFRHLSLSRLFGITIFWKLSLNLPQPTSQQCLCLYLCISISCGYLFTSSFYSVNKSLGGLPIQAPF